MSKKLLLTIYCLLSVCYLSNAQNWQWGKRGGSSDAGFGGPDETVVDMATDPHGNVYVLSTMMQTGLNVDGHSITGYGAQDILLTSFTCDGTYRWSKDLGGNNTDLAAAVKTDTLGGVYVTGDLALGFNTMNISSDSSWSTGSTNKSPFIAKFDTAGNYKWFTMPQPDTAGLYSAENTYAIDMDVDGGGNSYLLCQLAPGAYAGGSYIVTALGMYVLEYDKNKTFIGGTRLDISFTNGAGQLLKIKRDYSNRRYYVTGPVAGLSGTLAFGLYPVTQPLFIGCFNNSGTLLWQKQNTNINSNGPFARAVIDAQHNIYLVGEAANTDTFNGYAVHNALSLGYSFGNDVPLVVKMDTSGNNIWAVNGGADAATYCSGITLNGSEVDIAGSYSEDFEWPGFASSLAHARSGGYSVFITRLVAATGSVTVIDSLVSTFGVNSEPTFTASDKLGNFYVGGDFGSSITVNGTTLNSAGGGSDFFVAKFGSNNCDLATLETLAGKEDAVHIYPNPATDELNIAGVKQITTYKVLTMMGVVMVRGTMQPGANSVSLYNLTPGLYILELCGADGMKSLAQVVKE